ncbi:MAG: 50S ribosomal protein L23 [bacterium]|nr:50S ribosomal protein L23 [bacterium]
MKVTDVILRPLITEKAAKQREKTNEYFFVVHAKATKPMIRDAVQALFNVKVVDVRTAILPGKRKKVGRHTALTSDYKKAMVKLAEKETIKLFEGA